MTIQDQVVAGAEAFAEYEAAIRSFRKFDMRGLCMALFDSRAIGYLESQMRAAEFEAMAARHEAETFAMHKALTLRAQELGIDLPQPKGGGDR